MAFKFKVGDRIKLITDDSYYTGGPLGTVCNGDIVVINSVDKSAVSEGNVYGFEGDEYNGHPNWLNVEENFELVRPTLKELLTR